MNKRICYKLALISIAVLISSAIYALAAWASESIKMGAEPITQLTAAIIGSLLLLVNGFALFVLSGIRQDMKDVWDRMYDHEHTIECQNKLCKISKTNGVLIPSKGRK